MPRWAMESMTILAKPVISWPMVVGLVVCVVPDHTISNFAESKTSVSSVTTVVEVCIGGT